MFTGIIEEIGSIEQIQKGVQSAVLSIQCKKVLDGTKIGDSIAVNGVCLTVTSMACQWIYSGCDGGDAGAEFAGRI